MDICRRVRRRHRLPAVRDPVDDCDASGVVVAMRLYIRLYPVNGYPVQLWCEPIHVAMFEAAGFTIDVLATDTAQSAETEAA